MKRFCKSVLAICLTLAVALPAAGFFPVTAAETAKTTNREEISYMRLHNQIGPSGVALGGIGCGYFEIDPAGHLTRNCVNNIHKSFVDSPEGFAVAVYDGQKSARLARDGKTVFGMQGYDDSYYTGLWPTVSLAFENSRSGVADMGFSAYSGVTAQNVADSALPAVYYTVTLTNTGKSEKTMSALLTWGDLIGRGIRDCDQENPASFDGESADWYDMATPATYAKGVTVTAGGTQYVGVKQYADKLTPHRATFQNYNNAFMILAEKTGGAEVTILPAFSVSDSRALAGYTSSGRLNAYSENAVSLSAPNGKTRETENASAVAVSLSVPAGESRTVNFLVSWFAPEYTEEDCENMYRFASCDYNKYYHNRFASIEALTAYAVGNRENAREGIAAWQEPLLSSSLPEWLIFKQINSGYTLYSNGVLNKKGNFSSLEGEMGGYGGTMDQKMSSYAFYEKLFPSLNLTENLQYANVTGASGEIQHFDVHYYLGIADYDPAHKENPTPAGSMTDNTGSFMLQMWNLYNQTGDERYLRSSWQVVKTSLAFLKTKCPTGTAFPNYNTTYDDYSHPEMMIFSGTVWLTMMRVAEKWAALMREDTLAASYRRQYDEAYADVALLYGKWQENCGAFYAFGSSSDYIASEGASGTVLSAVLFSGAMAGQYMSRLLGQGDVLPFDTFVSHMETFLATSVQNSRDYYAPKVYNVRTEQDMDNPGSRTWPFYLDSYGGMAAIQAGYVEDGLSILEHTMLVDLRLGYAWTQDLWNRGYVTYMTTTVAWMINDVLAGAALDVPNRTLTLGPVALSDGTLSTPLYYPKYWARLDYDKNAGKLTYTVLETFYGDGESPLVFDTVRATPAGKAAEDSSSVSLEKAFTVTKGAVLDLSAYAAQFTGEQHAATLQPVEPYETPKQEVLANGTGLSMTVSAPDVSETKTAESIRFRFDKDNLPAAGVTNTYDLSLRGSLLPRYSQKYQIIVVYTGNTPTVSLGGKAVTDAKADVGAVESQQFSLPAGCSLMVITCTMTAGSMTDFALDYAGDLSDGADVLQLYWWSTTQQMGLIIKERMFPVKSAFEPMDGTLYSSSTAQVEGDHMAYTTAGTYAQYAGIDFGDNDKTLALKINAGAPDSGVSRGGVLEVRLDGVTGKLLGILSFKPTGGWANYALQTVYLEGSEALSGFQTICFVFKPNADYLFNYTTFFFTPAEEGDKPQAPEKERGLNTPVDGKDFTEATAQIEGDHMAWTREGTYATYEDIYVGDGRGERFLTLQAAAPQNDVSAGGQVEIHLDDREGALLGVLDFTPTGDWNAYRPFTVSLGADIRGCVTLCFVFHPEKEFLLNYTAFTVTCEEETPSPTPTATATPTLTEAPTEAPTAEPTPGAGETRPSPLLLAGAGALLLAFIGGVSALVTAKKKKNR